MRLLADLLASWFIEISNSNNSDKMFLIGYNTNLLLTEHEGRAGEYWSDVVAGRTERSETGTKTTEDQCSSKVSYAI